MDKLVVAIFWTMSCLVVSAHAGSSYKPTAAWGFSADSRTTSYVADSMFMSVGSGVTFTEDSTLPNPAVGCLSVEFSDKMTSKITLLKPSGLSIGREFGIVFYLNYNNINQRTSSSNTLANVLYDSGVRLSCSSGSYNDKSEVPAFQIRASLGEGYHVAYGVSTNCTQVFFSDTTAFNGWAKHAVFIKIDTPHCDMRVLSAGTDIFKRYNDVDCSEKMFDDSFPPTIGDARDTPYDVTDNFLGALACLQFHEKYHDNMDHMADLCQGDNMQQEPFYYWGSNLLATTIVTSTTTTTTTTADDITTIPVESTPITTEDTSTSTTTATTTASTTTMSSTAAMTTTSPTLPQTSTHHHSSCSESCYCSCSNAKDTNVSHSEIKQIVDEIHEALLVDKHSTSNEKRKKTSAEDHRQSAHVLATIGIGICTCVAVFVIGFDLVNIFKRIANCKYCH